MSKLTAALKALLDLVLVVPTHLLCWLFSWFGVLDARSENGRPSFVKLVVICVLGAEVGTLYLRATHGPFEGPTGADVALFVALIAAAFGRNVFQDWLSHNEWKHSTSAACNTNTNLQGNLADAIKAWRDTPHDAETMHLRANDGTDGYDASPNAAPAGR